MARRTQTYAIRLAVEGGGQVKAELVSVGQSGEQSLKRIETAGERASGGLKGQAARLSCCAQAWRARSIGRAATADRDSVPRRHGDAQGVATVIAAAAAAKLPLEVEQLGVGRAAVLQQPGVNVGPLSAGATGREDHMPGAQIVEPDGIARRDVPASFHSKRAMPERTGEQGRHASAAVRR